jgi:hypothetical protein
VLDVGHVFDQKCWCYRDYYAYQDNETCPVLCTNLLLTLNVLHYHGDYEAKELMK